MHRLRQATVSLAVFVLICFFLPWIQLSCVGVKDSASGFDLARSGDGLLWLVPLFMLTIIIFGLIQSIWERVPASLVLVSVVGGVCSAYVMYREFSDTERSAELVATQWAAWFWLGLLASIAIAGVAILFYSRRSRSP